MNTICDTLFPLIQSVMLFCSSCNRTERLPDPSPVFTAAPSLRTDPGRRCGPFPRAGRTGWSPRRAARVRSRRAEPPGCLSAGTGCRLRSWSWSSACACWLTAASPWGSDWWEEHRQTEGWGQGEGEGRGQRHRWGQGRGQDSRWWAVRCLRSAGSEVSLD